MRLFFLTVWSTLCLGGAAQAETWFQHPFGEERAYFGDWLAVCAEQGQGACRIVQTSKDPGSNAYFDTRFAVHRIDDSPNWMLEVMDRGMVSEALTGLKLTVDGVAFVIPSSAYSPGGFDGPGASDTVVIHDPELALSLVQHMRAGNRMILTYTPKGDGDGLGVAPLRGVTAGTSAIEARVLARQE